MTKLKTLKDWVKDITKPNIMNELTCCMVNENFIKEQFIKDCDKLKQEAIKWVKSEELNQHPWNRETREWIKIFFNITETELENA